MKKKFILSGLWICLLVSGIIFVSCDTGSSVVYPQKIAFIDYMGQKAGLTSSSTELVFINSLNETTISYIERQPITLAELAFDGVVYGLVNYQEISYLDIPQVFRNLCSKELDKKNNKNVGSCYYLQCAEIPGRKETGRFYGYTLILQKITEEEPPQIPGIPLPGKVKKYYYVFGTAFTGDIYPIR